MSDNKDISIVKTPQVICGTPDHPLKIPGLDTPLQCYVLEDETRVIIQGGMLTALGISHGGSGGRGGDRLAKFTHGNRLKSFVSTHLLDGTAKPIKFKMPTGNIAYGYEATILADICEAVLAAKQAGVLQKQQQHIAEQCVLLMRGFARVGIIALVDEVTGFKYLAARHALEDILRNFISKELQRWVKTFQDEFYEELFRLRGWDATDIRKRPGVCGPITVDLTYKRLAPNIIEKLYESTPKDPKGRLKYRLFQSLTPDYGHPRLREHIAAVTALMKANTKWDRFYSQLNRALPKYDATIPMLLEAGIESDDP